MKKIIFIFSFIILISFQISAQQTKEEKEDLLFSQKIAFITEKLQITPKEAQQFWPLYNEYWKKKSILVKERKAITSLPLDSIKDLTEKESINLANKYSQIRLNESQLFHEYNKKFQEVLPAKKVLLLFISDSEFKNYLLKQYKNSN